MQVTEARYAQMLDRINEAHELIERLREGPDTPKRRAALAMLAEAHARAILLLRDVGPSSLD